MMQVFLTYHDGSTVRVDVTASSTLVDVSEALGARSAEILGYRPVQ